MNSSITPDNCNKVIGRKIKIIRTAQDLTLEKLAKSSDINKSTLGKYELGKSVITVRDLVKISSILKIDIRDLFDDKFEVELG